MLMLFGARFYHGYSAIGLNFVPVPLQVHVHPPRTVEVWTDAGRRALSFVRAAREVGGVLARVRVSR